MLASERAELRQAVRGALVRHWPSATTAGDAGGDAAAAVWAQAVALGWTDLGGSTAALAVVAEELGRMACPLPVADAAVAITLFADTGSIAGDVAGGVVRPTVAEEGLAELGDVATHVLVLGEDEASLAPITRATPVEGMARPAWCRVQSGEPRHVVRPPAPVLEEARRTLRLARTARAMGAARRAHELAVQHAGDRVQFGRPIGAFQAVSHRLADAAVDVAGWDALVHELDGDDPLAVDMAVAHGAAAAVRVIRAAQRTLAAVGYFEEHELPWLFRRVHADLSHVRRVPGPDARVGLAVLDGCARQRRSYDAEADELAASLEADLDELGVRPYAGLDDDDTVVAELGGRGWIAPGLSRAIGGLGAGLAAQMAIDAVTHRRQVPARVARGIAATLGGVIAEHGTAAQRAQFLPLIATGRFRCYLGYSEPDVGSDLASLRTRARRDGDEWVVDGEKLWGTGAHRADYVWLAARTDPDAPKRVGITVFLAPTRLPGWTCIPHTALSGEVSCTTVFDGVRVPDSCRVGPVNGGWPVILAALAAERVVMAGLVAEVGRQLDELVEAVRCRDGADRDAGVPATLGRLVTRHQVALDLLAASVAAVDAGGGWLEAAMAKLVTSELAEDVALAAFDLLGPEAATGPFDHALRLAPMYVIGGGTADVQRNLIARGLGLPQAQ